MNIDAPNELAALPPWLAGYEMSNDDVALLTFADDNGAMRISASAVLPIDQAGKDYDAILDATTQRLSAANDHVPSVVAIVGHGPEGRAYADRVMDSVRSHLSPESEIIALHNDSEIVSVRTGNRPWFPIGPPVDVSAEMIAMGLPTPAASREMSDRMWQPDPVPGYPGLAVDERARLEQAPPSKRAEAAVEMLTELATGSADDIETTRSRVAALFTSNTQHWVQDHVMMSAATAVTSNLADELRTLYVQAPPEDQQSIAGTAALAAFAQHGNTLPLRAVRPQIQEDGPSNNDISMMDSLAAGVASSQKFQEMLSTVHERVLADGIPAERDSAWRQGQEPPRREPGSASSKQPPTIPGPEDLPPSAGHSGPSMI